ncbi:heterokaryon incompatibility protein-domain-containing protein [Chaetomidium leptoderma]|uniref:Heterokaryon incompatibility protein-domain-containing protein n=1 Tax=Chaetomidium leptoderma TaxID=669021 RepID=A0AAN6ZXQ0_9PEZI|nr:heterokaryon incompatibility protein-domain-containing protein [Chaetomidium leptoderma]
MGKETPRYVYSQITPDEFRVLKIIAIRPQIQFRLETFSIHEAPKYKALSYAWGTAPEQEESLCNGAPFRISQALGKALRGVYAHSGSGSWIWVDAICINQTDAVEKAHQVEGMGELYSYTDQVLVWLGEAADRSDLVCDLLPELTKRIWALKDADGGWRPLSMDEIVSHGFPPPDAELWRAAFLLYSRAWFQRLWIVQEIVLARRCVFLCGTRKLEWHDVADFAIVTSKSIFVSDIAGLHVKAMGEDQAARAASGIRLIRSSSRLRAGLEEPGKEVDGLYSAMSVMQSQGAFVKVDYVYAVLGMLPEALRETVVVDYSDDVKRNYGMVHASFFRQCLLRVTDWPSLYFPPKTAGADIPSWCPPWGSGWNSGFLPVVGCSAGRPAATSFLSSFNRLPPTANNDGDGILRIAGISVDIVRTTVRLKPLFDEDKKVLRTLEFFKDCLAHIPDRADGRQSLLGVLIGECGWLESSHFSGPPEGDVLDSLIAFLEHIAHEHPVNLDTADYVLGQHRFWRKYLNRTMLRWEGRSFGVTAKGRMGMVPCDTKSGDTVCVFLGATLPQVLSRHEDGTHWKYIGPSVVDGIMNGEIFDTMQDWMNRKEIFCLR